jgi:hypothetical protein
MKVGSMPVEAGGFGSGDPRISRRPKPGKRSRSKPVVRTSATYLSAGRTDGSCLGRRTSVACEDRTNLRIACPWRAVLPPINGPASGFHAFEPLAGGRNLNAAGRPLRSQRPSSMFQTYRGHRVDMRITHGRSIAWPRRSRAQFLQSAEGQLTRPPRHRAVPLEIVAVQYVKFGL